MNESLESAVRNDGTWMDRAKSRLTKPVRTAVTGGLLMGGLGGLVAACDGPTEPCIDCEPELVERVDTVFVDKPVEVTDTLYVAATPFEIGDVRAASLCPAPNYRPNFRIELRPRPGTAFLGSSDYEWVPTIFSNTCPEHKPSSAVFGQTIGYTFNGYIRFNDMPEHPFHGSISEALYIVPHRDGSSTGSVIEGSENFLTHWDVSAVRQMTGDAQGLPRAARDGGYGQFDVRMVFDNGRVYDSGQLNTMNWKIPFNEVAAYVEGKELLIGLDKGKTETFTDRSEMEEFIRTYTTAIQEQRPR